MKFLVSVIDDISRRREPSKFTSMELRFDSFN
jgi:hypothetical protein